MKFRWTLIKNAIANVGRGSAAAVVAFLLPPVLVRHMTPDAYAVWVLVLQTAAYASYLNFGLQTAIGRYVAYAGEKHDIELRDSVYSTAFAGLCGAAGIALAGIAVAATVAPWIFPSVPQGLVGQMRIALLIVGFALAIELPASGWNGVFIGLSRYEIPALTVGVARLISAIGLVTAALAGQSLVTMAIIVSAANLASYLAQYVAMRRVVPDLHFQRELVRRSTAREIWGYCFGLTVMSFAMLLITGFDLLLVGRFDFGAVIPYSVAASLVTLMAGLMGSVIGVIMPHAAAMHARNETQELGCLVISSTRVGVLLLVLTGMPVTVYGGWIMRVWIGNNYVRLGAPLLATLIAANIIRLIGSPYATVLVAAGQQNFIKMSPVTEAITNFTASVALGMMMGGMGVALGTLVGSLVSIGTHMLYSMPRTQQAIMLSRRRFVFSGIGLPLLVTSPILLVGGASWSGAKVNPAVFALAFAASLAGAGWLMMRSHGFELMRPKLRARGEGAC